MYSCSFCHRREDQVGRLVIGPSGAICNDCVDLCRKIITSRAQRSGDRESLLRAMKDVAAFINHHNEVLLQNPEMEDLIRQTLRTYLTIANTAGKIEGATGEAAAEEWIPEGIPPKVAMMPIEDLNLSKRIYHFLKRAGIHKVGEVLQATERELDSVHNIGPKAIQELKERLQARGLLVISRLAEPESNQ